MNKARISKPARNPMQSAPMPRGRDWLLEYDPKGRLYTEPLMGWAGTADPTRQIKLYFATMEEAIAYAKKEGIPYEVVLPKARTVKPKSYADNFRFDSPRRNGANFP